ncbi:MAG: septum formation family protein, partial [Pseudolysinimonas sp.]
AAPGTWFEPGAAAKQPVFPPATPHDPAPLDSAIAGVPHEGQPPAAPMPFETSVLPDVAPGSREAPPFWEPEPTQMMDALELEPDPLPQALPRQPFTRSVFPEGTELLPESASPQSAAETGGVSAIDSLFGESQFREYTGIADPNESPFVRRQEPEFLATEPGARPPGPPPGVSNLQRILLTVLGAMLAVIVLIGLFFLGIRLPQLLGPAPAITAPSDDPSPVATPGIAIGPVAPGDYHWDELLGGECLDPFQSAWQDDYTVVDCVTPHAAQMLRTAEFPIPDTGDLSYPGEEALDVQALTLCRATGVFSSAAKGLKDAQVTASYSVSADDWLAGNHRYYCFVSLTTGAQITGDIAGPQPTPTPTPVASDAPTG